MVESRPAALLAPRDALFGYLDELLGEAARAEVPVDVDPAGPAEPSAPPEDIPAPETPTSDDSVPQVGAAMPSAATATSGEVPEWARPDFQALLFRVGRLKLAVPLIKLHGVLRWGEARITALPNQPEWCLGAMRVRGVNMVVVATDTLVLPAHHRDSDVAEDEPTGVGRILVVGDGHWGLTCASVGDVVRLRPDEVRWRGPDGRRPWLAGTVTGHLCALMDTGAFADMLEKRRVPRLDDGTGQ